MSQVTNIFGANDDEEILTSLYTIVNVGVRRYWFSHADSYIEHWRPGFDTRVYQYLQRIRLYSPLVRVG
jgi:hypothetical protein